jgi:mRNA interferase RelE/StbE
VASYNLRIKPSAAKELEALPRTDRQRIITRVRKLSDEPRPSGCEKLSGHNLYRIRQGNYRILYTIQDADSVIVIIAIGHRREVHR